MLQVCTEILGDEPPELAEDETLCSLLRFIYRGRQLSYPKLTLGALRIKANEKIMVLTSKRFSLAIDEVIYLHFLITIYNFGNKII